MGTLNKFAGKIKSLFTHPKPVATSIQKEHVAEVKIDKPKSISARSYKKGIQSKPPWWVRFYGKKTRSEVGSLNLHWIRTFGSFSKVRRFGQ